MADDGLIRCHWVPPGDPVYAEYHDREWGAPLRDDQALFELLILESFQAGLSWRLILGRREEFRRAFDGFDAPLMSAWSDARIEELMQDAGIIRNRQKIRAARSNAGAFLKVQNESGSFSDWLWQFVGGTPVVGNWHSGDQVPARTELSDELSKEMRRRGFAFVGSVTIYSYLQAAGLVQDHLLTCFRHARLTQD